MEPPETRYADADGVGIAYQELGAGDRTMVFVTNWATNLEGIWYLEDWVAYVTRLARSMRVLLLDVRGSGMSDRVPWASTPEEHVADIRAVVDAAGCDKVVLTTVDAGTTPTLWFAAAHPERVEALVLLGCSPRFGAAPGYEVGLDDATLDLMSELIASSWGQANAPFNQLLMPGDENERMRVQMARVQRQAIGPSDVPRLVDYYRHIDCLPAVPRVTSPALLVHATDDLVIPLAAARWLADALPDAKLVELPSSNHYLWGQERRQLVNVVLDFLGMSSATLPDGRLLAIVMTDIVGSTERAASLGAEQWRRTLDRHDDLIRELLPRFDGTERSTAGDSFLATFPSAGAALSFGLEAARASERAGLPLRIGVHVGDVQERDGTVHGLAVHVAARVQAAAGSGQVVTTAATRDALVGADGLSWEPLGEHALKGVPGTWSLWQVTGT